MNTPTTLLDLIRDDAHAAGFQSLGQYRKALIEAATAAATITIGETHSPVKVRLGLRLIGDEEVATITLTQHDQAVILHCADQAHAARIAAAIEALPASPAVQGEPVYLYRRRDLHDFITCNHERYAKLSAKPHLFETKVLYTAPQPAEQQPTRACACTVPDDCETLHWRGQILSMNELASVAQPAAGAEIMVNAPGDVYTLPMQPSGLTSGPRFVVHVPAQQSAEHRPYPEGIREGAPYDDPAFSALCREHEVYGTAAAAQCAVFWEAGKRVAEQKAATGVKALVEALESLIKGYVGLLEAGMDRITSLGGDCDPVPVMEQNDPWLRDARAALAAHRQGGEE